MANKKYFGEEAVEALMGIMRNELINFSSGGVNEETTQNIEETKNVVVESKEILTNEIKPMMISMNTAVSDVQEKVENLYTGRTPGSAFDVYKWYAVEQNGDWVYDEELNNWKIIIPAGDKSVTTKSLVLAINLPSTAKCVVDMIYEYDDTKTHYCGGNVYLNGTENTNLSNTAYNGTSSLAVNKSATLSLLAKTNELIITPRKNANPNNETSKNMTITISLSPITI